MDLKLYSLLRNYVDESIGGDSGNEYHTLYMLRTGSTTATDNGNFRFVVNTSTGSLNIDKREGGSWVNKTEVGSLKSELFIVDGLSGIIAYEDADGDLKVISKPSVTGEGAVFGDIAGHVNLVSNGTMYSYEFNQTEQSQVLNSGDTETQSGNSFTYTFTSTRVEAIKRATINLSSVPANTTCRAYYTNSDGVEIAYNNTVSEFTDGDAQSVADGENTINIKLPHAIPNNFVFTLNLEFKDQSNNDVNVTISGSSIDLSDTRGVRFIPKSTIYYLSGYRNDLTTSDNVVSQIEAKTGDDRLNYDNIRNTGLTLQNEGTTLSTKAQTVNFVGNLVDATGTTDTKTVTINGIEVQEEGTALTTKANAINFVGSNVTATGTGNVKTVTIDGLTVQDEGTSLSAKANTLNFVGTGVTASGTGATKTITINSGSGGDSSEYVASSYDVSANTTQTLTSTQQNFVRAKASSNSLLKLQLDPSDLDDNTALHNIITSEVIGGSRVAIVLETGVFKNNGTDSFVVDEDNIMDIVLYKNGTEMGAYARRLEEERGVSLDDTSSTHYIYFDGVDNHVEIASADMTANVNLNEVMDMSSNWSVLFTLRESIDDENVTVLFNRWSNAFGITHNGGQNKFYRVINGSGGTYVWTALHNESTANLLGRKFALVCTPSNIALYVNIPPTNGNDEYQQIYSFNHGGTNNTSVNGQFILGCRKHYSTILNAYEGGIDDVVLVGKTMIQSELNEYATNTDITELSFYNYVGGYLTLGEDTYPTIRDEKRNVNLTYQNGASSDYREV